MTSYYNSPDEIRQALGLEEWDTFKQKIQDEKNTLFLPSYFTNSDNGRRTGRTTKMLVEAIYESQSKPVAISAFNEQYEKVLVSQARIICEELGISANNIYSYKEAKRESIGEISIFVDHFLGLMF